MQIRETIDNPSTASTESPPEDLIVLVHSAGIPLESAARVQRESASLSQSGMACDRGFRRTKAVAGSQRAKL
ncbi:hypothetical protein [Bradyrhizobium sp. LA6.12]|uniref:hypothetical protein n=1 Tax=unclassified Bradyrhizobium TaxID=2631580 RepID=UPI00339223D3